MIISIQELDEQDRNGEILYYIVRSAGLDSHMTINNSFSCQLTLDRSLSHNVSVSASNGQGLEGPSSVILIPSEGKGTETYKAQLVQKICIQCV